MATPVPPNKNPTPKEYLPPPPTPEMKQPADYKKTLQAHKDHRVVSKVCNNCRETQMQLSAVWKSKLTLSSSTRVRRQARRAWIASSERTTTRRR